MKKTIPMLLNLFLFPMGYFYMRQTSRLILGAAWVILAPGFLRFLLGYLAPESTYGWPQIGFLAVAFCGFLTLILYDTIRLARSERPKATGVYSTPSVYFMAPLIFLVIMIAGQSVRSFGERFIRFNSIISMSMTPNLISTDYVYWKPIGRTDDLRRGEIVLYSPSGNPEEYFLSRVIGLPGETVEMEEQEVEGFKNTLLMINGRAARYTIVNEHPNMAYLDIIAPPESRFLMETLPTEESHRILEYPDNFPFFPYASVSLGPAQYFLVSDNRDDSKDSRFLGPVSRDEIKGRLMYVVFSINNGNALCDEHSDPSLPFEHCVPPKSVKGYIRWDRIGLVPK